eukprot:SAG31_NODE_1421_length_8423_cov_2.477054_8_plen_62_part_00
MLQTHNHHAREAERALLLCAVAACEVELGDYDDCLSTFAECQRVSRRWMAESGPPNCPRRQ